MALQVHGKTLLEMLVLMLKPVARFCLRHSISVQDLIESAKIAMISASADEIQATGRKVTI
ncbi:MAG: hypothetical protein KDD42_10275, partial [Bdellovibrionales bacterium]|nr:hypothetical protein [Bdellovibrionales bacterium]